MFRSAAGLLLTVVVSIGTAQPYPPYPEKNAPVSPDVTHLKLHLVIDDRNQAVEGTEEIRYTASGRATDNLWFGERGLQIIRVEADPSPLRGHRVEGNRLEVQAAGARAGTNGRVRVEYRAQPKQGLYFHNTVTERGVAIQQVWQFNAWEDWMPKPADPNERMSWDLDAEVRKDWQVVSNGELLSVEEMGARRCYHWRQPIAARLDGFTFAAGNFDVFEQRSHGRRFISYVPSGVADAGTVNRSLGRVGEMCDVFSREFGYPCPFVNYRQVVLWDYHPQGTEHAGLTQLSENKLIDENVRLDADDYIVAHELSHSWWAMLVGAKSAAHVWLTEGFAVYFGNQYFEIVEGRDEFEYRLRKRLQLYLQEDHDRYRRVLVTDEPVPGGLDEHIYSKGAYTLHMLRRWLGDKVFFHGIQLYATKHAFGLVDSDDLRRAMEEAAGRPLDWYFRQWLYRKGYPAFKVERRWEDGAVTLKMEQTQAEETYRVPVWIEVVTEAGAERHMTMLEKRAETRRYALKGKPLYVRFDADHSLLATVNFPRPAGELSRQLADCTDAMGRAEAADALAGAQGEEGNNALRRALRLDLFHGVRSAAAAALAARGETSLPDLLEAVHHETDSRVLQNLVAALEPFAGSTNVQKTLKMLAVSDPRPYVRARALLALARAKAEGAFELLVASLDQNAHRDTVRASVFQGFAALGDPRGAAEIMRYLQSDVTTRWAREPAVEALGKLNGRDADVRRLLEHMRDQDFWPGVRRAAARAIQ